MAATYHDIRRLTGLSLATISKYFNGRRITEANRELIDQAVSALGYHVNDVARGLRSRRTMTVGVVLDELNSTFNTTIVSRMDQRLREHGYATIICDARGEVAAEAEAIGFLIGKMVDGIVVIPVADESPGLASAGDRGVPVVTVDRLVAGAEVDAVVIDNRAAVAAAVELLVDAGHTQLGLLAGPGSNFTMRERRAGFSDAVAHATGAPPRPELVLPDEVSIEGGYDGMRRLRGLSEPPTAVVCANYEFTLGATIARQEGDGPAPAMVGFDNLDLARVVRPRPTLVVQPVAAIADHAGALLLERMRSDERLPRRTITLGTDLVIGDPSTYLLEATAR